MTPSPAARTSIVPNIFPAMHNLTDSRDGRLASQQDCKTVSCQYPRLSYYHSSRLAWKMAYRGGTASSERPDGTAYQPTTMLWMIRPILKQTRSRASDTRQRGANCLGQMRRLGTVRCAVGTRDLRRRKAIVWYGFDRPIYKQSQTF